MTKEEEIIESIARIMRRAVSRFMREELNEGLIAGNLNYFIEQAKIIYDRYIRG